MPRISSYPDLNVLPSDVNFLCDSENKGTNKINFANLKGNLYTTTTTDPGVNAASSNPEGSLIIVYE